MISPTPESYASLVMPRLEGWAFPAKIEALTSVVRSMHPYPRFAVEIGVFGGRSLFAIALAMAEQSSQGLVLGIDPWQAQESQQGYDPEDPNSKWWAQVDHDRIYQDCIKAQKELGLGNVQLYRGTSAQALPHTKTLGKIDLLHIDGNHTEDSALFDVLSYVPLVRPGGIICMDDINWASTAKAQEALAKLAGHLFNVGTQDQQCGFFRKI